MVALLQMKKTDYRGYQLFPKKLSLKLIVIWKSRITPIDTRIFLVTIETTVVGTVASIILTTSIVHMMAKTFRYRNVPVFFVYFTMLF